MKKFISIFTLTLLFIFTLSTYMTTDLKENVQVNKEDTNSIDKVYDTWEEAREYEYIYHDNINYKFHCAYRVEDTKRFKVTYVKDINEH